MRPLNNIRFATLAAFSVTSFFGASLFATASYAEDPYPSHPIKIVVAASPGAGSDVAARVLAAGISGPLGQPVVIENIEGAASVPGTNAVAHAKPDGYTLLATSVVPLGVVQNFRKDMPYDGQRDLIPVSQTDQSTQMLVINPQKLPVNSVAELVDLLKKDPGKYNFATSGPGQMNDLSVELFMQKTGTKMVQIPYKGSGESMTALMAGTVDMVIDGTGTYYPQVKAGKLRALAISTPTRQKDMPDIPTVTESVPSYPGYYTWRAIFAPKGTPEPIIAKLNKAISDFTHSPDGIAKMNALAAVATSSTPEELGGMVKRETAIWSEVIKAADIKPQ